MDEINEKQTSVLNLYLMFDKVKQREREKIVI